MELTFTAAITACLIIGPISIFLAVAAIARNSGVLGWISAVLITITFVLGILSVVQADEEDNEDYAQRGCITVDNDTLWLTYNNTNYVVDTSPVVLCKIP